MIFSTLFLAAAISSSAPAVEVSEPVSVESSVEVFEDLSLESSVSSDLDIPVIDSGSSGVVYIPEDNSDEVSLLSEAVELLAENSATVSGNMNSQVLDLMDRIINGYPDFYQYAGFRVDSDDSYRAVLYVASDADVSGNTITFSDDCKAINFYRYVQTGYSSYIYYVVSDEPGAVVNVSTNSICYSNALTGYPELGSFSKFNTSYIWVIVITVLGSVLLLRRVRRD